MADSHDDMIKETAKALGEGIAGTAVFDMVLVAKLLGLLKAKQIIDDSDAERFCDELEEHFKDTGDDVLEKRARGFRAILFGSLPPVT